MPIPLIIKLVCAVGYPLLEYYIGKNTNIKGNSLIEMAINKIISLKKK